MLVLALPIACTSEAPHAAPSDNVAAPTVSAVPIVEATPIAPAEPPPDVSRGTSASPAPAEEPDASYRAIGTEPFWAVTISDDELLLERPDHSPLRITVQRKATARSIEYSGDGFTLTATPGPCSDGMSDAIWSDRVQIAFADGTLKGCGGIREARE